MVEDIKIYHQVLCANEAVINMRYQLTKAVILYTVCDMSESSLIFQTALSWKRRKHKFHKVFEAEKCIYVYIYLFNHEKHLHIMMKK